MTITAAIAYVISKLLIWGPLLLIVRSGWLRHRAGRIDTSTMHGFWLALDALRRCDSLVVAAGCWFLVYAAAFVAPDWRSHLAVALATYLIVSYGWTLASTVRLGRDLADHNAAHGLLRAREVIA